jgi:hypothetical protein
LERILYKLERSLYYNNPVKPVKKFYVARAAPPCGGRIGWTVTRLPSNR